MLSDVFCAPSPRLFPPNLMSRIRGPLAGGNSD
jgi:hypothetical protein